MKIDLFIDYLKGFRKLAIVVTIFGVFQFFLLTSLAAFFYPGGYDYFGYYFSDLGAVVARNGELNSISKTLFSLTLIVIALILIPFWLIIRSLFIESRREIILSKIGSILGVISSPFIIGIALFPIDTQLESHILATLIFILLFIAGVLLYSIATISNQNYPNFFGLVGFALFIIPISSFAISLMNTYAPLGAFLQKIALYGYFIWVLLPIYLVWSSSKN